MGSRGRSIRLRIYFLVAIPLVALVGLLAYVAGTSVNNAISLDRVPNLINATAIPAAKFGTFLETERAAAVVYLFQPTAANLAAYETAAAATDRAEPAFLAAMNSQGTTGTQNPAGAKAVSSLISGLNQLPALRNAVKARALSPLDALGLYSQGTTAEAKLFLIQTESVTVNDQLSQGIGLITAVQGREQLSQEDALLSGMLAAKRITAKNRIAFTDMAASRQADAAYADYILSPANVATYNAALAGSGPMQQDLTAIEQAVAAGTPAAKLPVTLAEWQHLAGTLLQDQFNGGVAVAGSILEADHQIGHSAWVRVAVTSGIALLGLLITMLFTILIGRGIIRRLRGLERSALELAEVQLPEVVGRLRRGETVDASAEAPPLRTGGDEIGRVGQAFELVRQTAIRAAVEEAKLRQGLNDVFRSLARRSQSLLHRQLTLLDQMERRATDPEALDDLFRLDHLTTRMRRHAEGLVILAGAPPGRAWSSPVRMVDVMRGAIAEVEDYARVSVATRSQAALAGSAVADVIHLLAELIENATTLSPPYTSVRVSGDTVANGFAIEVEDRGLGMSAQRLAELNERLASPPEFNPSDSEQLGLFVVSQLAKRHGIRVTLKASPYGGTSAVVLIPSHLVVTEEAFRAGLPGEPAAIGPVAIGPAAMGMAGQATNGNHADAGLAAPGGFLSPRGAPELDRQGFPGVPGIRISGPLRRSPGGSPDSASRGAHAAAPRGGATPAALGPPAGRGPGEAAGAEAAGAAGAEAAGAAGAGAAGAEAGASGPANGAEPPDFDVFMPRRRGPGTGDAPVPAEDGPGGPASPAGAGTPAYVSSPPFPGPGSVPYADQPAPFPGWTGRSTAGDPAMPAMPAMPATPATSATPAMPATPAPAAGSGRGAAAGPGMGAPAGSTGTARPAGPVTPMTPVASPRPARSSGPPWELSRQTGPLPAIPADGDPGGQPGGPGEDADVKGLPRRVKQASIAPQLRDNPPRRRTSPAPSPAPASGPTPTEIRQTMSALQRGWQEGRSQRIATSAPGGSPFGPFGPSGQGPPGGADGDRGPAADDSRGESDGT
jgi:signal transduction histidine kinase